MYILTNTKENSGYNGGFMTDNIDNLLDMLRFEPTMARQLDLTPEEQVYLAKEDIMIALSMKNPCLEIGLIVVKRFWCHKAFNLIKLGMDDETVREFHREVNKLKLFRGPFEDSKRFELMVDGF